MYSYTVTQLAILHQDCNIYPSINTFYNYISADSITRSFSCTDDTAELVELG